MLLESISSEESLRTAWEKLNKSNPDSHGISGESIDNVKSNLINIIPSLSNQLKEGKYRFKPTRAELIPKGNDGLRPLRIPEVRDRIILKSIALKLEELLSDELAKGEGVSFAYQKNIGIEDALTAIVEAYNEGYNVALKCDIIKFFDRVNRNILLEEKLFPQLPDESIKELLWDATTQKIGNIEEIDEDQQYLFEESENGIPQGNPLSPLLSNLYLADFDKFMQDKGYKLVRYADDFLVMLQSREEAIRCYEEVKAYLNEKLSLELHPLENGGKSKIININNNSIVFLSVEFDGNQLFPSEESVQALVEKIKRICSRADKYDTVLSVLEKLKYTLVGWVSTYSFCKVEYYIRKIDYETNHQILKALRSFGWNLTSDSLYKLPSEFQRPNSNNDCLSMDQRTRSGVPKTGTILESQREENQDNG